jgi:hypothetical protein
VCIPSEVEERDDQSKTNHHLHGPSAFDEHKEVIDDESDY